MGVVYEWQCNVQKHVSLLPFLDQFNLVTLLVRFKMNWGVYLQVVLIFQEVLAIDLKHFKEMKQLVN